MSSDCYYRPNLKVSTSVIYKFTILGIREKSCDPWKNFLPLTVPVINTPTNLLKKWIIISLHFSSYLMFLYASCKTNTKNKQTIKQNQQNNVSYESQVQNFEDCILVLKHTVQPIKLTLDDGNGIICLSGSIFQPLKKKLLNIYFYLQLKELGT